jgi:N-acetylglucosamine kinase-like BadF-type ATPase
MSLPQLLVDGGSTKADWLLLRPLHSPVTFTTIGVNPLMLEPEEICRLFRSEIPADLYAILVSVPFTLRYYGAGCRDTGVTRMETALRTLFPQASLSVASDLLGAARALWGEGEGIACILGTGANSGHYRDGRIVCNISPLGYLLGDEGSGAVLGRRLVADVLKQQAPAALCAAFSAAYPEATPVAVLEHVYHRAAPNRYLAQFVPFLKTHEHEAYVRDLLLDEFSRFFCRNVSAYGRRDLKVSFVGSVAYHFRETLQAAAESTGYQLGEILQRPFCRPENL